MAYAPPCQVRSGGQEEKEEVEVVHLPGCGQQRRDGVEGEGWRGLHGCSDDEAGELLHCACVHVPLDELVHYL